MHIHNIANNRLTSRPCFELYKNKLNNESLDRAAALREVIHVQEGLYRFSNSVFSIDEVNTLINSLAY